MKLTIFTPTYNRKYCLPRLYESLHNQTVKNFEWIIIDDDSSDNTEEYIKELLLIDSGFDIIYKKQEHGGKHRAINKALDLAKGEYFFIVDSDDMLVDNAVEIIHRWINDVESSTDTHCIAGVSGLRMTPDNKIIGGKLNIAYDEYIVASNFERKKYGLNGDKAEIYKTSIMKKYKFPEFEEEYFVTEAVCWNAMAYDGYNLRWYNTPIYICEYRDDGLTKNGANEISGRIKNFKGYCYYVKQSLDIKPTLDAVTDFRAYNITCKVQNIPLHERNKYISMSKCNYYIYYFIKQPIIYSIRLFNKYIIGR